MEENDFAAIWLEETGNPAIEELAEQNVRVANQTVKILAEKDMTGFDLAHLVDVNPDEIERWLQGIHTFSMKMITEISLAMNEGIQP